MKSKKIFRTGLPLVLAVSFLWAGCPLSDDVNVIAVPENIQATPGDAIITLTWDAVNGATKYEVLYGVGDAFDNTSGELTATYCQISGLTNGQTYKLKVRAGDNEGWSDYSVPLETALPVPVYPPSAPVISGVVNDTTGQLTVTWEAVEGAAQYRYTYATVDAEPAAGTETTALAATITGLDDSTLYYLWVAAGNGAGWSAWTKTSGATKTPVVYTELKRIVFDNLSVFRMTDAAPPSGGARYDWQGGGGTASANVALSNEQDHTTGAGKSIKFSNRTEKYYRVKFEKIFSVSDVGRTFKTSMWVYTPAATTVQLGVFRISGGTLDGGTAAASKTFEITTGWNELVWDDYVHTDSTATQLAIEQPNSSDVTLAGTLYLDDIVVKASPIIETVVKNIVFDDLSAFEMTANPPGEGGIKDWQAGGGAAAANVALSSEQDHTSGAGKSLKFFNRTDKSYRIKFDGMFSAADTGGKFNAGMWVYTDTATWIQLTVYRVSGLTYPSGKSGSDIIQRQFFRVEPGWNELVWRGYVHEDTEGTQLGIEQQGAETAVGTLYIDDLVVTKVAAE